MQLKVEWNMKDFTEDEKKKISQTFFEFCGFLNEIYKKETQKNRFENIFYVYQCH